MAAKKKARRASRLVCPKTYRGKKVIASKGGCWIRTRVRKVAKNACVPRRRRRTTRRRLSA